MKYILIALLLTLIACQKKDPDPNRYPDQANTYTVPGDCSNPILNIGTQSFIAGAGKTVFNTGYGSERLSCLPTPYALDGKPYTLYQMNLVGIKSGDTGQFYFSSEVTCEITIGGFLAWYIEVLDANNATVCSTLPHGTNVTMIEHHHVYNEQLDCQFSADGDYTVNVKVYGAIGPFTQIKNAHLVVEQDYGELSGVIFR